MLRTYSIITYPDSIAFLMGNLKGFMIEIHTSYNKKSTQYYKSVIKGHTRALARTRTIIISELATALIHTVEVTTAAYTS